MKSKSVPIPQITTVEQAIAHQRKHGFLPPAETTADDTKGEKKLRGGRLPNKTEAEFGRILEAQKSKGEIVRYEFEGIRLKWGVDEKTGNAMWYKPDWYVVVRLLPFVVLRIVEIKGAHIWDRDTVRFKGARAAHPEFEFEMWQKAKGLWNKIA